MSTISPSNVNQNSPDVHPIPLNKLFLDEDNPRFGMNAPGGTQRDVLNAIVRDFGVNDVLSSIAVNGYFSAEPLICRQNSDGSYTVVEGNRRLAASLILADDERAIDHNARTVAFQKIHESHGRKAFNPIPCIVFGDNSAESQTSLLSYLGIRHIVSTKDWDSYAKAAWVSKALKNSNLKLTDISEMIGDRRQTVRKLVEGINFIQQLEDAGKFNPENSQRKGRGSNTNYPFSWVYTLLSYKSVRDFTGIKDNDDVADKPIKEEKIDNAILLVNSMFGDKSKGKKPAINDSRMLGQLAEVIADPIKASHLRQGKSVEEIQKITQPVDERVTDALLGVFDELQDIHTKIISEGIPTELASSIEPTVKKINKLSANLVHSVSQIVREEG